MTKKFTRLIARRLTKSGYVYCLGSLFVISTTASAGAASLNASPPRPELNIKNADIVIRGNVKDEGGVILRGVCVKVKETAISTSTGEFASKSTFLSNGFAVEPTLSYNFKFMLLKRFS